MNEADPLLDNQNESFLNPPPPESETSTEKEDEEEEEEVTDKESWRERTEREKTDEKKAIKREKERSKEKPEEKETVAVQVKDFPLGYPRYSALLASDTSFQVWRQFSILRTRLLLLKQDELSLLEEQLEDIDAKDNDFFSIYLTSRRRDENETRKGVLQKIDDALKDYDSLLERNQRALSLEISSNRALSNLRNWNNHAPMEPKETKYLHRRDLASLLGNETWSDRLVSVIGTYLRFPTDDFASDGDVKILTRPVRRALLVFQAALMAALLFTPVIICNFVTNLTHRMIIIVVTTAAFIALLSFQSRMKTFDLVIAGTTYATVLVVFISGTNGLSS